MSARLLARLWHGLRFRDALLITFLPLLLVVYLVGSAVRDYLRARQYDDWFSREQNVAQLFSARAHAVASLPKSLRLRDSFSPDDQDASIIRFEVPASDWDSLEVEQDGHWAPWIAGTMRYGKSELAIRLRKRGDNSVHWLTDKRSLTVRTPRDDFYKRFRSFALSAKEVAPSYLANRLGQEFDLVIPATDVSPVYVNNRFFGIFRFVELVDESFLRPLDLVPGNIFRGDAAERGEYYKGTNRNLFANARIWDRAAVSDRWTGAGPGQLQLMLQDLAGTTLDDHVRLMNRFDRGEYARLFAYLFLMGDPYHIDGVHNDMLYEDPSTSRLHPIPWDTRLRDLRRVEQQFNDLFSAVLHDPFVLDSTMQAVSRYIEQDAIVRVADSLAAENTRRYGRYLEYDRLRTGLVPDVGSMSPALAMLRSNVALLRSWLSDDTVAIAATTAGALTVLDLETRGRVGVNLTALTSDRAGAASVSLRLDVNGNGAPDALDPVVVLKAESSAAGTRYVATSPIALLAGWDTEGGHLRAGHMPYRVFVSGLPAGARIAPELHNRVTGAAATVQPLRVGETLREGSVWHPWRFTPPAHRVHRFAGEVRLSETLKIPAGDTLIIEPGTTLRLAPEVSIVSRGRVIARGTADRPIRILPQIERVPWGAFSLQEHGADSSVFRHVEFAQGGGALIDRIEYTGMVNLHRVNGAVFDSVTFRENLRSDDGLHALYSVLDVTHSRFVRTNSDAFDLDISSGNVTDNEFVGSGNDGLDLMSATPVIANNHIVGSGDKGISVGENSRPFIFNNLIENCTIGIETKDKSDPIVLNNVIAQSKTGLRERRKNWRYGGGGWPVLAETRFDGNKTPWKRDVYSRVTLQGVTGLDTSANVAPNTAADVDWLYQLLGIAAPSEPAPGLYGDARLAKPVPLIDQQTFEDNFGPVADGWRASGGVDRLEKRRDALVIEAERGAGSATRTVQWRVPAGAVLVLELAARDVANARVVVRSKSGTEVSRTLVAAGDLATSRFYPLSLPAGEYTALTIQLSPIAGKTVPDPKTGLLVPRSARIDLRNFRLVPPIDSTTIAPR